MGAKAVVAAVAGRALAAGGPRPVEVRRQNAEAQDRLCVSKPKRKPRAARHKTTPLTPLPTRRTQPDEEAALTKVAALTATSLGLLLAADADGGGARWVPTWDASVHASLPALRLVRWAA